MQPTSDFDHMVEAAKQLEHRTPKKLSKPKRSSQLANENVWKKPTIKFHFFPRAGHALDPRDSVNDLSYRQIPGETLEKISTEMEGFFR